MGTAPVEIELLVVPGCPNASATRELLPSTTGQAGLPATPIRSASSVSSTAAERRGFIGSPTILINGVDSRNRASNPRWPAAAIPARPGRVADPAERLRAALTDALSSSGSELP